MTGVRAIAAWPGPALVAGAAAAVAAGMPAAPALVLGAAVAPLLALAQPARATLPRHPVTLAIFAVAAALLLCAHLAALADAAVLLGARRWPAIVLAAALALGVTTARGAAFWRSVALAIGAAALLVVLIVAGLASGLTPWAAWADAAARPGIVFSPRSAWVTGGERFLRPTTLAFTEAHRIVAVTPGTFRAVEMDGAQRVVRDWRLNAGDVLSLRPGDTLTVEAGSRLRFEPGKRVPGAPPSGSAWVDAAPRGSLLRTLALLATLALGAYALIPPPGRHAAAAFGITLALGVGAVAWGVYATLVAPEAGLAGSPVEALLALPRAVPATALGLGAGALTALVVLGLLALFVAAADALRTRVADVGGPRAQVVWALAVIAAAVAASVWVVDPWTPLAAGLGVAGAGLAAPRLAAGAGAGRRLGAPVEVVGALLGAGVFVALSLLEPSRGVEALGAWPVLVAAPIAFGVVSALRSTH